MHKAFIGPLTAQAFHETQFNSSDVPLAEAHRATLINTCINTVAQIAHFLELLGGGSHRYFIISMAAIEMTAVLGTCIISDHFITQQDSRKSGTFPPLGLVLRVKCIESFEKGLKLLDLLAQISPLALKGARIMRQLELRILHEWRMDEENSNLAVGTESPQASLGIATEFASSDPSGFQEDFSSGETSNKIHGQDFMAAGWESFSPGADMS
jgi:hypothetical protein